MTQEGMIGLLSSPKKFIYWWIWVLMSNLLIKGSNRMFILHCNPSISRVLCTTQLLHLIVKKLQLFKRFMSASKFSWLIGASVSSIGWNSGLYLGLATRKACTIWTCNWCLQPWRFLIPLLPILTERCDLPLQTHGIGCLPSDEPDDEMLPKNVA